MTAPHLTSAELAGRNVLILGLGLLNGGTGLAQYCYRHGANLRITDNKTPEQLATALHRLEDIQAEYTLGRHELEDVEWADIVFRNPAVPPDHYLLQESRRRGLVVDMEVPFFIRNAPGPVIAVTGTKGKTTTTAVLHAMLESDHGSVPRAGNMGTSAIQLLDSLAPGQETLLETSSYQLEGLEDCTGRIQVGVIVNIGDDHLDRYGTIARYRRVKALIAAGQTADDWLILPGTDRELLAEVAHAPSRKVLVLPSKADRPDSRQTDVHAYAWIDQDTVVLEDDAGLNRVTTLGQLPLAGRHNALNAAFAAVAAWCRGRTADQIERGIRDVAPVPHRYELLTTINGVTFINDTAATAPMAVVAALESTPSPVFLIAGGHDKSADFASMVRAITERPVSRLILLPGSATDRMLEVLEGMAARIPIVNASDMDHAVGLAFAAATEAANKSWVLLSPGCASFGLFVNEFDRGEKYKQAVSRLTAG